MTEMIIGSRWERGDVVALTMGNRVTPALVISFVEGRYLLRTRDGRNFKVDERFIADLPVKAEVILTQEELAAAVLMYAEANKQIALQPSYNVGFNYWVQDDGSVRCEFEVQDT